MKSLKLIIILLLLISIKNLYSQWGTNTNVFINAGGNSFQSAGIGTSSPQAPLHIIGNGTANAQGWKKSIILDNNAALYWKGSQNSYFMAHPSNTPAGDFYQGISAGIGTNAAVTYTGKVFASNTPPAGIPKGSTQIFKNLIVLDFDNTTKRSLGVNILVPKRSVDITNNGNTTADAQLRLTHTAHNNPNRGIWTDFQTTNLGNLYINPRRYFNGQSVQRNVGIAIRNPNRRLDVYDSLNAQIRLTSNTTFSNFSYTDLKTTNHLNNNFGGGHLLINPAWGLAKGFVAINMLDSNTALNTNLALYVNGQQNLRHAVEGDTSHVKVMVWDSVNNGRIKWRHADSLADKDWLVTGTTKIPHSINDAIYTRNEVSIVETGSGFGGASLNISKITGTGEQVMMASGTGIIVRLTGNGTGINSLVGGSTASTAGRFWTNGTDTNSFGVWAHAPAGGLGNGYAVYADGNVFVNGDVTANNYFSDSLLKSNIDSINNANFIIAQLKPKSFFYDTLNNLQINFPSEKQYGFLAQNVALVLPELVTTKIKPAKLDSAGNVLVPASPVKRLNYNAFIAILTKALQEQNDSITKINSLNNSQQSSIDSLTTALNSLSQQFTQMKNCLQPLLNFLCGNNNSKIENLEDVMNIINVELSNGDAVVLEQNAPNPFNENTSIKYYIPENINYAQIIFTDMHGRIIKTVDIKQSGNGQLKVYAANLSQGIYQYSIVVDGKIIDTKKMVVEK